MRRNQQRQEKRAELRPACGEKKQAEKKQHIEAALGRVCRQLQWLKELKKFSGQQIVNFTGMQPGYPVKTVRARSRWIADFRRQKMRFVVFGGSDMHVFIGVGVVRADRGHDHNQGKCEHAEQRDEIQPPGECAV